MSRQVPGFAVVVLVALLVVKIALGLLGALIGLAVTVIVLAALGYCFYLVLRVFSPSTAERIRQMIRGSPRSPWPGILHQSKRSDAMKRSFALLAFAALPLAAQQPRMGHDERMMSHMMQMEQMMAPMMRAMAFTPDHLLARKDSLHLTPQQITRLTMLQDAAKTVHDAAAGDANAHMDALAQAWSAASPDTVALKQHFQAAHSGMGNAHWAMLAAAAQARGVLNDEQRARVDRWATSMMHGAREHH